MPYVNPDIAQVYRAFDMAYFPDPAYCLWIAHLGNRYIAFKEKLWKRAVAPDIARDIVAESEGLNVAITFCDPSMASNTGADVRTLKDIFEDNGVPMEPSVNNRELYAHHIHMALSEEAEPGIPKLQIYAPGCPYLIKTLPLQRYDPKHPLKMADHKEDHAAVTLAYFLISGASTERRTPQATRQLPRWMRKRQQAKSWVLGSESVKDRY
jgi:hypothetical protein